MGKQSVEVEASLHLFRVLSRAYQSISEHSSRSSKAHGFHPTEFSVLELLYHKGPQPLKEIGSQILLTSGSITYVVDKLEKLGLLRREHSSEDRRMIFAVLTEKGEKLLDEIFPIHAQDLHQALSGLDDQEREECIRLLKKLGYHAKNTL